MNYIIAEGNRHKDSIMRFWRGLATRARTNFPTEIYSELNRPQINLEDDFDDQSTNFSVNSSEPSSNFRVDIPHAFRRAMGLVANLCLATTQAQVIGLLSTYVLATGSTETWSEILSYLRDNVLDTYAVPEQTMVALPDWLQALKSYQMNWKDLAQGKTKTKVEQLLGILVAFNLCEASNVTFQMGRFLLFKPFEMKNMDVFTIFDVMFEIGVYFIEVGYCSWKMRAPRILFLGVSGYDIDTEFAQLREYWKYYELGNLNKQIKISEASYFQRLNQLHNNLSQALKQVTNPVERNMVAARRSYIGGLLCAFDQKKLGGAPKVRPLMICLFGESSVGKSPMMDVIIQVLLTSRGFKYDPAKVYTRDSCQKFWSGCTSDMLGLKMDDPTFSKNMEDNYFADDTRIVCNNQAVAVNMAEADNKGKVVPCFQVAVSSTNAKTLRAQEISYCPWAFQRRNDFMITVKVKSEFQVDGNGEELDRAKVASFYDGEEKPLIEDLWDMTVEIPVKPKKSGYNCRYEHAYFRGEKLRNVSLETVLQFLIVQYNSHMDWQEGLVEEMTRRANDLKCCPHEGCKFICGHCPDHEASLAVAEIGFYDATKWMAQKSIGAVLSKRESTERKICALLLCQYEVFWHTYEWLRLLPTWVCNLPGFALTMSCIDTWGFSKCYLKELLKLFLIVPLITLLLMQKLGAIVLPFAVIFTLYRLRHFTEHALIVYQAELLRRNRTLTVMQQRQRDMNANAAIAASTAIAAMYIIFKSRRLWKEAKDAFADILGPFMTTDHVASDGGGDSEEPPPKGPQAKVDKTEDHPSPRPPAEPEPVDEAIPDPPDRTPVDLAEVNGSFEPDVRAEILARDRSYNDWGEITIRPVPVSDKSKTMSHADFTTRVKQHLWYCQLVAPNGDKMMVQLLMVSTGFVLLPYHYFQTHATYEATGFRSEPTKSGGRIATRLSLQRSYRIPDSDLCLCCVDSGGAVSGLLDMFPIGDVDKCAFTLVRRLKTGDISLHKGRGKTGKGSHTMMQNFNALMYEYLETTSSGGWCGAPLISEGKHPSIVGLHVAGCDFSYRGYACTVTQDQLRTGIAALRAVPGTLKLANAVASPNMGSLEFSPVEPHQKSPMRYMPREAQFSYHGNTGKHTRPRHQVKKTPIAKTVAEVFEVEDTTQPPGINPNWLGLQKTLSAAAVPGLPHRHELMVKAAEDYVKAGCAIFSKPIFRDTHPLSESETINGIPGVKFIDPINVRTSAHPLPGIKLDYMEGEPGERVFNDQITSEWRQAKEWLLEGIRLGFVSKTCLKSEAYWKWKCRYFYVAHIILTLLIRQYFLPLIRVMQLNPFVFECAVGLNAHGPDWDALHQHVFKYGAERLIGGDYREYDTRIPAQGIQFAMWCLLQFAKCCNYSDEDLELMEAIAVELIYPVIDVNGDLISLSEGTHISGNSLTVILNGIVGSLNMRCFFFQEYPDADFREAVSLITYGDDNAGSVAQGFEKFNIENFAHYLEGIGQIYTMPDKEQELQPYLDPDEFEFLKRKSVYHEELGCRIGALLPKSMLKSLLAHNYEKNNPLSEMEVTTQAMESFVIECFNHGPEFHKDFMTKLREVAHQHDLTHMVRNIHYDYDSCVEEWKQKYTPESAGPVPAKIAKDGGSIMDTETSASASTSS